MRTAKRRQNRSGRVLEANFSNRRASVRKRYLTSVGNDDTFPSCLLNRLSHMGLNQLIISLKQTGFCSAASVVLSTGCSKTSFNQTIRQRRWSQSAENLTCPLHYDYSFHDSIRLHNILFSNSEEYWSLSRCIGVYPMCQRKILSFWLCILMNNKD